MVTDKAKNKFIQISLRENENSRSTFNMLTEHQPTRKDRLVLHCIILKVHYFSCSTEIEYFTIIKNSCYFKINMLNYYYIVAFRHKFLKWCNRKWCQPKEGLFMVFWIIIGLIAAYFAFEYIYFRSKKFLGIKESIQEYTNGCNELNAHIEDLKNAYVDVKQTDYGHADYVDQSVYNFRRPELKKMRETPNIYNCSITVCKNAQQQPFKYLCKYFNIKPNEETLANFENVLNSFAAVEQGKVLLEAERNEIVESIRTKIPFLIRNLRKKTLIRKLGFDDIDFSQLYFPKYSFKYVSAGGNSSMNCDIVVLGNL